MCLIISIIFTALAYTFFEDGNMQGFYINISIAIFFVLLMIKNIIKTKKER
jgi:hypothetical protein